MIQNGILNPGLLELLARIRHTNTIVIADWAFPSWPEIQTTDLSLTRGIPLITDVLDLLHENFKVGRIWQAEQFLTNNAQEILDKYAASFNGFKSLYPELELSRLPHDDLKKLVPESIGLIRTGDTTAYGNVILQSI